MGLDSSILLIIITLLSVLVVILTYTTINLLKKNEKAEDLVVGYLDYLDKLSRIIEVADKKLETLDSKGFFKSDDEIGFFFEQVKGIQKILNEFKVRKY